MPSAKLCLVASSISNTTSVSRLNGGCNDTDNNAADFVASTPIPRNTSTSLNQCGGGPTPTPTADARADVVHVNAEFVDQTSDHDPQVARLFLPPPDADGDGVIDAQDNSALDPNADQRDTDE